jgi:asparagine synthase (glutamine-hydrolysing)
MSGIVGIINLDGAPVDEQLLRQMTAFMAYRGPDAQEIWIDGHVGFGHTMLRTTFESEREQQPCSLDGQVWITADARIDARDDLIRDLRSKGREIQKSVTDVELILHAYHVWGDDCVQHLIGDFAFAIWDGPQQRLFCARDHFGIKPFYYAPLEGCLIFSNTLNCIREHPAVSDTLNEVAIGDFLLFDLNQDPATTVFADIQCLPPAHCLTYSEAEVRMSHYWTLPFDSPIRYKRSRDYVDHFRELLRTVVDDRLRTDRLAVYMSGGLDSTAAAATARELLAKQSASFDLRAHTVVYDRLIPDEERYYSGLVANALGIPIDYLAADDYKLFERWNEPEQRRPEPDNSPRRVIDVDQLRQIAAQSRVAFYCEGPDNLLLYEWQPYVTGLITGLRFGRLLADVGLHFIHQRRLPFARRILNPLKKLGIVQTDEAAYPPWLKPAFASRLGLRDRWEQWLRRPASDHLIRPRACASLKLANWRYIFESSDPGVTRFPVEIRHPYMDIRMARYLLAVPPIPWCADKHLVRETMRGILPEPVRRRPKASLAGDPVSEHLKRSPEWWRAQPDFVPAMGEFLQEDVLRRSIADSDTVSMNWINLRPFALNYWLQDKIRKENHDETRAAGIYQEVL